MFFVKILLFLIKKNDVFAMWYLEYDVYENKQFDATTYISICSTLIDNW